MADNKRQIKALVENAGLTLVSLDHGKHYKAQIRAPDGRTTTFIAPRSASDHRTQANQAAWLRRWARGTQ